LGGNLGGGFFKLFVATWASKSLPVRFTPNSDRENVFSQMAMSALPPKAGTGSATMTLPDKILRLNS
jgi:hypothetical protein